MGKLIFCQVFHSNYLANLYIFKFAYFILKNYWCILCYIIVIPLVIDSPVTQQLYTVYFFTHQTWITLYNTLYTVTHYDGISKKYPSKGVNKSFSHRYISEWFRNNDSLLGQDHMGTNATKTEHDGQICIFDGVQI